MINLHDTQICVSLWSKIIYWKEKISCWSESLYFKVLLYYMRYLFYCISWSGKITRRGLNTITFWVNYRAIKFSLVCSLIFLPYNYDSSCDIGWHIFPSAYETKNTVSFYSCWIQCWNTELETLRMDLEKYSRDSNLSEGFEFWLFFKKIVLLIVLFEERILDFALNALD